MARRIDLPCDALAASYRAGQSTLTLAHRHGCSPTTIAKRLRSCGIALRDARFTPIQVAEGILRQFYLEDRLPLGAIAARLGVSVSTVNNRRRSYNIPIRPRHLANGNEAYARRRPA
jgi:transcriptional regulator of aromatic amino acid metabolism